MAVAKCHRRRDHPRLCGEKVRAVAGSPRRRGSPPLVRGKDINFLNGITETGITPACAGKRMVFFCSGTANRDHPPACAGKSLTFFAFWVKTRDHPRLRGEKDFRPFCHYPGRGSPPLARGKGRRAVRLVRSAGITPACAGKSITFQTRRAALGDHPRLRGEKKKSATITDDDKGSPPLARGKGPLASSPPLVVRITPAYAGKSAALSVSKQRLTDHPRLRGEKWLVVF